MKAGFLNFQAGKLIHHANWKVRFQTDWHLSASGKRQQNIFWNCYTD